MAIEIKVPTIGESVTEVEIGGWLKRQGDAIRKDEPLVTLESEKATVELPAPEAGTLATILKQKGEVAMVGETIAYLDNGGQSAASQSTKPGNATSVVERSPMPAPESAEPRVMPAAQRVLAERGLRSDEVQPSGPGGRLLKEDVLRQAEPAQAEAATVLMTRAEVASATQMAESGGLREEEVVPMSRLRRTVAERLVEAQRNAALLTTVNEIDIANVGLLRKQYGEAFQHKHNVKLGLMSFFVKACIDALKQYPVVNAEIRGTNIVYHNYYDIGVAVGSGKGLVVPVLRNAERMSFAELEIAIADFGKRAKENKLKLDELQGGTFTISNGGVYGSLLSTPIVNPPQSGVLGMHAIQDRPVALEGTVVIRPMMYVALTYDHRLVDGREAVSFLKRIKEVIESPARMLMEI